MSTASGDKAAVVVVVEAGAGRVVVGGCGSPPRVLLMLTLSALNFL